MKILKICKGSKSCEQIRPYAGKTQRVRLCCFRFSYFQRTTGIHIFTGFECYIKKKVKNRANRTFYRRLGNYL